MDITLIAIAFFIVLAIAFLFIFLFKSFNKKTFKSADGSVFNKKSDLEAYECLYEQTKQLFESYEVKGSSQEILGFDKPFLSQLTQKGFPDLKTLVKYKKQIALLLDLINA